MSHSLCSIVWLLLLLLQCDKVHSLSSSFQWVLCYVYAGLESEYGKLDMDHRLQRHSFDKSDSPGYAYLPLNRVCILE